MNNPAAMARTIPAQPLATPRIYGIHITEYYLSEYPVQTSPGSPSQVLAYMTLIGQPVDGSTPVAVFYIQFYPDGTTPLSGPGVDTGTGTPRVILDMYYSQLASLVKRLDDTILDGGPACSIGYTDGPPVHAEFIVDVAKPVRKADKDF